MVARLVIQWLSNIVLLQHVHVLFSNHFWQKADNIYVLRQKMNCLNKKECVQRQEQSLTKFLFLSKKHKLGLVADPVIEGLSLRMAWGRESSLEAAGALRAAAPILGSIPNSSWGWGWSWGWCSCHEDAIVRPNSSSAEFSALVVLNHSCYVKLGFNWL